LKTGHRLSRHMHDPKKRVFTLVLVILALIAGPFINGSYGEEDAAESEVKAAFVYNFIKFVDWPAKAFDGPGSPIVLGILGKDDLLEELETIKDRTAQGRKLTIKRSNNASELERCHIIYVSKSERDRVAGVLKSASNWSTLTIADIRGFAQAGGMINFTTQGNKISFEINPEVAERAGLKVSSKLLKLAKIVGNSAREGK
jgi:hypothetical protein